MLKSPHPTGHDDSGYAGPESVEKICDEKREAYLKDEDQNQQMKDCTRSCQQASKSDQFWFTTVNYLVMVVVGASLCYMVLMGDYLVILEEEGWAKAKLGGKRAAIQFYYDNQVGV